MIQTGGGGGDSVFDTIAYANHNIMESETKNLEIFKLA
jgi:hypothetical protein